MTSYVLYLNSSNKLNGSLNNNATFYVDWANFFPHSQSQQKYKVSYSFLSNGGYYKDNITTFYSSAKIYLNFGSPSLTFNSETNGPSHVLGLISRDVQGTTTSSNYFSAFYNQYPAKIIYRPTQNIFSVNIVNTFTNTVLTNTDNSNVSVATGDMTNYNLIIEFVEV